MAGLPSSAIEEIRVRMAGLNGADSRRVALELAESHKVSETTIYRHSSAQRAVKERTSRGQRRLPVEEEVLKKMMGMTYQTDAPATEIVKIFEMNGLLPSGMISPAWYSRWLAGQGMSRREMKIDRRPFRRFEASEPGEVYQIDATIGEQYYIDDDGSVCWEARCSRNKNRAGNRRARLVLLAAIDDHSRCIYAEFTTGQTVNHWLTFLFNAFRKKDDPRFRFFGIPRCIYMDNDSVAKNKRFNNALLTLGVKVKKHKPTKRNDRFSNARSKGKIERLFKTLADKQRVTKLRKFSNLEEANEFLFEACLWYNTRRHSTTGEIPDVRWNRIRPEMLVHCEDDALYHALYREEHSCHVNNNLVIRLDGEWQLPWEEPFYAMIGQKVTVFRHPLEKGKLFVQWQGREYEIERQGAAVREWAEGPVRKPVTQRQALIETLENEEFSDLKLYGFDQGPEQGIAYLPTKEGVELDTSRFIPEPPRIARVRAMKQIAQRLERPLTRDENRMLSGILTEQVTEEEIEVAFERLTIPAVKTG